MKLLPIVSKMNFKTMIWCSCFVQQFLIMPNFVQQKHLVLYYQTFGVIRSMFHDETLTIDKYRKYRIRMLSCSIFVNVMISNYT